MIYFNRSKLPFLASALGIILIIIAYFVFGKNPIKKAHSPFSGQSKAVIVKSSPAITDIQSSQTVRVLRVIDGDTIEIENGQKVRYIGINTPETVDPQKPVECFGKEASDENKKILEGQKVILEKDVSDTDKYGRLLRYVYLPQNTDSGTSLFVNDYLVREGFAQVSTFPPDVKYQNHFLEAQQKAKSENKGLWGSCNQQNQSDRTSTAEPNNNCIIKGNISSSGEKIYHMPSQRYYDKTTVDESKGEKWFCSESEAQKEGWRKSKI